MEKKQGNRVPILIVTKGNTDGSILEGDRVYYRNNKDLVCHGLGDFKKNELTPDIIDFKFRIDKEYEIMLTPSKDYIVPKTA